MNRSVRNIGVSDAVHKFWDRDGPYGGEEYVVWASPDVWTKLEENAKYIAELEKQIAALKGDTKETGREHG